MSALEQNCEFSAHSDPDLDRDRDRDARWEDDEAALEPCFTAFYREHYPFVWRSARRMLGTPPSDDAVEDLIQDTFVSAYRRFDSFDPARCRPTTWLFGILRNVARNHRRGERRRSRRHAAVAELEQQRARWGQRPGQAELGAGAVLARHMLEGFLRGLDEDKRAVFVLAELEGASGREIAEALDINANTAHSRLRAARREFCSYFDLPRSREAIRECTRPLRERPEQPPAGASRRSHAILVGSLGKGALAVGVGGAGNVLGLSALTQGLLAKLT
ncbi:MAG: sigma-70 family RNA polymerase sigma factor, partial [Myxococcales bacterium]|nr:sigma-70 family RNA polymerase sigma factor [Myxococcales bacterium]